MKGRFAPSPTGRMHLGNVYSALLSWLSAKARGGEWLLRIEDIDPQRSKREFAEWIMEDLQWLGLEWDEGPYYQSERGEVYEHYLDLLKKKGLVYPCYCTRADILATQAPHESDGRVVYKGTCRELARQGIVRENGAAALRLMVEDRMVAIEDGHYGVQSVNLAKQCGDFIVRRKDGAWAYQLAVVVDDALMGITEVVRGRDLLLSSPQQAYTAQLLGFDVPSFCHLPLLCNEAGQRLSKRDRSMDMSVLRSHMEAKEVLGILAHAAGILPHPTPVSAQELLPIFSWNKVLTEDIVIRC